MIQRYVMLYMYTRAGASLHCLSLDDHPNDAFDHQITRLVQLKRISICDHHHHHLHHNVGLIITHADYVGCHG